MRVVDRVSSVCEGGGAFLSVCVHIAAEGIMCVWSGHEGIERRRDDESACVERGERAARDATGRCGGSRRERRRRGPTCGEGR